MIAVYAVIVDGLKQGHVRLVQEGEDSNGKFQEWYIGEESLYLYYNNKEIRCLAESLFTKKLFESKTKLKLEEIN